MSVTACSGILAASELTQREDTEGHVQVGGTEPTVPKQAGRGLHGFLAILLHCHSLALPLCQIGDDHWGLSELQPCIKGAVEGKEH